MSIGKAFDRTIQYYDDWMKIALPHYETLFSTAVDLIPFDTETPISVLDLGAGTGLFSACVLAKYHRARITLYDLAPKMLKLAKERFKTQKNFTYLVSDYQELDSLQEYDLVISSLSIHHLEDEGKRRLFKQIHQSLKEGGIFINIDQIKGPTPEIEAYYWQNWLRSVRAKGAPEEEIQASIERRQTYDKDALLSDQLRWLSEAKFNNVDCIYKDHFVGVFFGKRSGH